MGVSKAALAELAAELHRNLYVFASYCPKCVPLLLALHSASAVKVYFEWGRTTDYGSTTRPRTVKSPRRFQAVISGLRSGVTYHFRAIAVVGDDVFCGDDRTLIVRRHRWFWW